ncbi:cytochrome P450 9e2-like [Belonocnema kinseyi]|uniref:cytochrome P450 9e2-like n=1 Tax=Belonocnema kinseyi TaxID=2817044 RepID=UPI00143CEE74|nr:cytochrome P450 9e2-like [Belonocnema kinseyi]
MMLNLWTVIAATITCGLGIYLLYSLRKLKIFKSAGIPHNPPIPFFGNMAPMVFRRIYLGNMVKNMYDNYSNAKYFGMYDFMKPVIVLRDLELVKSIGVKNFESFPNHRTFVKETWDPLFARNLFSLTGEKWHNVRNLLSPAFTSSKMKTMYKLISQCAIDFTEFLAKDTKNNQVREMKDAFTRYTNDVIATCAFGIKIDSMKNPENEFYLMGKEGTDQKKMTPKMFLMRDFPWIVKLFNIRLVHPRIAQFFTDIIESTISIRDKEGISRPDMLQLMMENRKNEKSKVELTLEEMTAQAFIFFFGGFDTTSTNMSFAAHELAVNPEIQARLQGEIDKVLRNTNGDPSYEAINGMEYLDAVLNETLRKYPLIPVLDRVCSKQFELPPTLPGTKPFIVKPGMIIWLPAYAIQHDADYFEEPEKFNPDRFLKNGNATFKSATFLSFGIGPRQCIGNRFAMLETKAMLFHLLARCNLKVCSKTSIPLKLSKTTFGLTSDDGYWLSLESKNNNYIHN